eukprot:TRINITY_DN581_c0_g1_i3.p1 TRINITY_DN581_c0_g1~~TRINITY_DN581_c0_g1_i3.p1  ORF type:complete len:213 (-),score=17.75 TRINITY_DN581_c0_g1_i3:197-835(-)
MKFIVLASLVVESCCVILGGPLGLGAAPAQVAVGQTAATAGTVATGATAGTVVGFAVPGATALGAATIDIGATEFARGLFLLHNPASMGVLLGVVTVGAGGDASAVTWDCWKPIVHDNSTTPSRGRPLIDILKDPVISDYSVGNHSIVVRNRWNESWRIDPLILPWGEVAAHASQIASSPSDLSVSSALSSMSMNDVLKQQILVDGSAVYIN